MRFFLIVNTFFVLLVSNDRWFLKKLNLEHYLFPVYAHGTI